MNLTPMMTIKEYANEMGISMFSSDTFPMGVLSDIITDEFYKDIMGDNKTQINLAFFAKYGNRQIAPLLELVKDEENITSVIDNLIAQKYKLSWSKIYTAMTAEYSPIENTDRYQNETRTITEKENTTNDNTKTQTQTSSNESITNENTSENINESGTETIKGTDYNNNILSENNSNVNSIKGFNNSDWQDESKTSGTLSHDETDNGTRTEDNTNTKKAENTSIKQIDVEGNTKLDDKIIDDGEGTRDLTHVDEYEVHTHGNIGVTTNQQMIEAELILRKKQMFDIILQDVANEITCPLY